MSDERRKEQLIQFLSGSAMACSLGLKLRFDEGDRAVVELPYNPSFDNALGAVHGGAIATLMDVAGWCTAVAASEQKVLATTAQMSFHLLRPAEKTALTAHGNLLQRGNRQAVCEMRVTDEQGLLVAHGTGTFVYLSRERRS